MRGSLSGGQRSTCAKPMKDETDFKYMKQALVAKAVTVKKTRDIDFNVIYEFKYFGLC